MQNTNDPLRRISQPLVPEIKTQIGAALKTARLRKSQSLEAVSQQTRISKKFLEALEENRFEEFPALAYLRGFLKSYCDYLELDFDAFWKAIQTEKAPAAEAPKNASPASPGQPKEKTKQAPRPAAPTAPSPSHGTHDSHAAHAPAPAHDSHAAPAHAPLAASVGPHDAGSAGRAVFFGALLCAGVVFVLTRGGGPAGRAAQGPAPLLQLAHPPVEPTLVAEVRQDCWLAVRVDGATRFEGLAPKNSRLEWKASKSLSLRTSSPEALKLSLNGAPLTLPAPSEAGDYLIASP
jgi:transcriptional regulator with XRE-family HTH domain